MAKEIILPEGWEVDKIENGKVILKEVEDKYPKTWEKCLKLLPTVEYTDTNSDMHYLSPSSTSFAIPTRFAHNCVPEGYCKKVLALCQLLICRNAYWGNWVPNWKASTPKYVIRINRAEAILEDARFYHQILAFPDREMRDTFYKNFKDLIEEAKELL